MDEDTRKAAQLTATAVAWLATLISGVPVAPVLNPALEEALARLREQRGRRLQERTETLALELSAGGVDVEQVVRDATLETVDHLLEWNRALNDVLCPRAELYLCKLSAEYIAPPANARDAYFRRVSGLLRQVDARDLGDRSAKRTV